MSGDFSTLPDNEEYHIGGYVLLSPIGKGAFSKVILARHLVTGTEVAVKIISRQDCAGSFQEVTSLKMLNHPNITKLFQVINTQDQTFLFMENVTRGHLLNYLRNEGPLAEEDARAKFRQMTSAIQYCHHKGIIHRDLKLENILLDEENNIKVADFGFSTKFSGDKLQTFCGTLSYMAPEILKSEPYDGQKVDAWSLGVILYIVVTGRLPFERTNFEEQKQKILSGHFHIPDTVSVECQELLKKLLTVDPSQRITVEEIMDDQWVNIGYEEALRPYSEPPGGDIDPRVIEMMEKLGYKKEEIEDSVSQRKYDDIMGTYMILQNRQKKMVGRTIRVRPCPASDPNISPCATQGAPALGQKLEKCSSLPCSMEARVPSTQSHMEKRTRSLPPSLERRMFIPSPSLQVGEFIPLSSLEMKGTTDTEMMEARVPSPPTPMERRTSSLPLSLERRMFIPSPNLQVGEFIPLSSLEMKGTTDTEMMEARVSSPPTPMERRTSSLPLSLERRMFIPSPSLQVAGFIPLSSLEMKGTTDTEMMEARVPSLPSLMEMRTSSLLPSQETRIFIPSPSLETRRTIATDSRESRMTNPQSSLDSTKSIPPASPASRVTSSLPSPGSRTTAPIVHSSSSCIWVGTPASPSGSSHGREGVARRVLRFFLKCFCCCPSTNKQHQKRKRVKPI